MQVVKPAVGAAQFETTIHLKNIKPDVISLPQQQKRQLHPPFSLCKLDLALS